MQHHDHHHTNHDPEIENNNGLHNIKQESNHAYDSDDRDQESDPAVDLSTQN